MEMVVGNKPAKINNEYICTFRGEIKVPVSEAMPKLISIDQNWSEPGSVLVEVRIVEYYETHQNQLGIISAG